MTNNLQQNINRPLNVKIDTEISQPQKIILYYLKVGSKFLGFLGPGTIYKHCYVHKCEQQFLDLTEMAGKTNYFGHKLFATFSEQRALTGELKKEKAMLGSANQRGWPKTRRGF